MENFLLLPRALATTLFDAGFAGACGALLASIWLGAEAEGKLRRILQNILTACALAMLLTLPLQLWLLTAMMLGTSSFPEVRVQLMGVLTGTHAGKALLPDFAIVLMLFLLSLVHVLMRRRIGIFLGFMLIGILTLLRSATGHAAADGDFTIREILQFLHLLSIAVWSGGVILAGLFVLPCLLRFGHIESIANFGRRLSRASTVAVSLVILSGIYNAWRGLDASMSPLLHSQWGGLLMLKNALVLCALGLGVTNHFQLKKQQSLPFIEAIRFATRMRIEAFVMLSILIVTGWLANSPPPMSS